MISRPLPALLQVPVGRVEAGIAAVPVCCRHGLPAVKRVHWVICDRDGLSRTGSPVGGLVVAIARIATVKQVKVTGWPLCRRCVLRNRFGNLVAAVLGGGALTICVLGGLFLVRGNDPPSWAEIPVYAMLIAPFIAVPAMSWAGLPKLTRAYLSDDGGTVTIEQPHPDFRL